MKELRFTKKEKPAPKPKTPGPVFGPSGYKWGLSPEVLTKRLQKWHEKALMHLTLIDDSMNDNRTTTEQRIALREMRKHFVVLAEITPAKKP